MGSSQDSHHFGTIRKKGKLPRETVSAVEGSKQLSQEEIAQELEIKFGKMQEGIYARLVEKVGDRLYWENWAKKVGDIAPYQYRRGSTYR